jgi:hypothetical protein
MIYISLVIDTEEERYSSVAASLETWRNSTLS